MFAANSSRTQQRGPEDARSDVGLQTQEPSASQREPTSFLHQQTKLGLKNGIQGTQQKTQGADTRDLEPLLGTQPPGTPDLQTQDLEPPPPHAACLHLPRTTRTKRNNLLVCLPPPGLLEATSDSFRRRMFRNGSIFKFLHVKLCFWQLHITRGQCLGVAEISLEWFKLCHSQFEFPSLGFKSSEV